MQLIVFKLNDEFYAFDTGVVENINDMMEVTKVPKSPAYIRGLINLRGNIISLLDLKLLLNLDNNSSKAESIIILKLGEESIGTEVDEVDEVIDIDEEIIETLDNKEKKNLRGVINLNGKIITIINISNLVQS